MRAMDVMSPVDEHWLRPNSVRSEDPQSSWYDANNEVSNMKARRIFTLVIVRYLFCGCFSSVLC